MTKGACPCWWLRPPPWQKAIPMLPLPIRKPDRRSMAKKRKASRSDWYLCRWLFYVMPYENDVSIPVGCCALSFSLVVPVFMIPLLFPVFRLCLSPAFHNNLTDGSCWGKCKIPSPISHLPVSTQWPYRSGMYKSASRHPHKPF